ncbi:unnamed protein product, partial [Callosobruchus maculatus]
MKKNQRGQWYQLMCRRKRVKRMHCKRLKRT